VSVGIFSYRVSDSEDFDEARGEITAYSPRLVEEAVFSEVQLRVAERRSVNRVMSSSCSQPSPTKE
jgi:hypothetical protein